MRFEQVFYDADLEGTKGAAPLQHEPDAFRLRCVHDPHSPIPIKIVWEFMVVSQHTKIAFLEAAAEGVGQRVARRWERRKRPPSPSVAQALRSEFGRPRSSMRLRTSETVRNSV